MNNRYVTRIYAALITVTLPLITLAQNADGIVKCGPTGQQGTMCTINDFFKLFVDIFNYLLGMGAIVAFVFLIYGGIKMFLYSVDEENLAAGKKTVVEALIGLAIILLAYVLINTLLTALGVTNPADYFNGTKAKGG